MNPVVRETARRIAARSRRGRGRCPGQIRTAGRNRPERTRLGRGFAAASDLQGHNRNRLANAANIGFATAGNDMLRAHRPRAAAGDGAGVLFDDSGGTDAICQAKTST